MNFFKIFLLEKNLTIDLFLLIWKVLLILIFVIIARKSSEISISLTYNEDLLWIGHQPSIGCGVKVFCYFSYRKTLIFENFSTFSQLLVRYLKAPYRFKKKKSLKMAHLAKTKPPDCNGLPII